MKTSLINTNHYPLILILVPMLLLFLTGCGDRYHYLPQEGIKYTNANKVSFEVKPYTEALDNIYHFGRDFTFVDLNSVFLVTVQNRSDAVIEFRPTLEAALVDNLGRQFKILPLPIMPSLEPLTPRYKYDLDYRRSFFNTELEDIDDELERLYERELFLEKQVSYIDNIAASSSTQDIRDSMIAVERELLSLERSALELKRAQEIKSVKKKAYQRAMFKDGLIYPGAIVSGLIAFESQLIKNGNYRVKVMFSEPETKKLLQFKFHLVKKDR